MIPPMEVEDAGSRSPVEARGSTLGEAKWSAIKALKGHYPWVEADDVAFEVLDEGDAEAGRDAVVRASVEDRGGDVTDEIPDDPAERVRTFLERVTIGFGLRASVDVEENDEEIYANVNGEDLGLMIGKHGVTIDAIQHLASRIAFHGGTDRKA